MQKKVLVFGSFDIIHPGHLFFFKEARKHGDQLIVVVARDKTVKEVKGAEPESLEQERLLEVSRQPLVDKAVLGNEDDKFKVIKQIQPDVICLGYDQKSFGLEDKLKQLNITANIIRIPAFKPELFKSSKLR